jgi:hypothetical protein
MFGSLAMLSFFSFVEFQNWNCDGSEKHLHANGKLYAHHHEADHHNQKSADDTDSETIVINENINASSSGLSKINCGLLSTYDLSFRLFFKSYDFTPTLASEPASVNHLPDKVYLLCCSMLI